MDQNKSSVSSIIGIIVIIAIIVLGGLYFWGKRVEETKLVKTMTTEETSATTSEQNEATAIRSMGSSDDTASIEADLNNTKTTGLDAELSGGTQ